MIKNRIGSFFASKKPTQHQKFFKDCHDFLREYVPFDGSNLFVSGGFFPRRWLNQPLRDIDVYVNGDEQYLEYLKEEYSRLGWTVKPAIGYGGKDELHHICSKEEDGEKIQIDLISFHQPKSIKHIETFDFDICQIAMDEQFVYCAESY